jgi:hypothetical protein
VILLDTSVLIDHLRGDARARTALSRAAASGDALASSVLTKVEILAGMRPSEEAATQRLLDSLEWIEVDDDLVERAGQLANRYLRSHPGIDPVDYVIAATAARLKASLWTLNLKHFPMFEGLTAPY